MVQASAHGYNWHECRQFHETEGGSQPTQKRHNQQVVGRTRKETGSDIKGFSVAGVVRQEDDDNDNDSSKSQPHFAYSSVSSSTNSEPVSVSEAEDGSRVVLLPLTVHNTQQHSAALHCRAAVFMRTK